MRHRASYFAAGLALAGLGFYLLRPTPLQPQDQPGAASGLQFRITLGLTDTEPKAWTGKVGVTGSEGGDLSHQVVSDFTYVPLPTLSAEATGTNTVVLSWPVAVAGFVVQSKASLSDSNPAAWVSVTSPVLQSNGSNQVVVPAVSGGNYYRLVLP